MLILGTYLDSTCTRTALIKRGRKTIEVRALEEIQNDIPPNEPAPENKGEQVCGDPGRHVKQQYNTPKTEAVSGGPGRHVKQLYMASKIVSGIAAKDFLIRSIELKISSKRHVEEVCRFQSEATSHFNPADVLTTALIQKKDAARAEALLFTVPKEALKNHLEALSKLQIDPDTVTTSSSALCHFIRWKFPHLLDAILIDLGSSITTCVLMEDGRLKRSHAVNIGIERLLSSLLEDRKRILLKKEIEGAAKQIDLLLLKPGLNPSLSLQLNELRQEIAKAFYLFSKASKKEVIFTGRTDAFIHLRQFILEFSENEFPLTLEEQKFAIPIGLAIEGSSKTCLELRRDEFFPPKKWRWMGTSALLLLSCSIFLSVALFTFSKGLIYTRQLEMAHSLRLSKDGPLEDQIDRWITTVERNNKEYPYILQAPKVVEVLAWLSAHPLLKELEKEQDPIEIKEIHYQLVTLPLVHSSKDRYLAKVEIEFQFLNAIHARKFHEALRKGDQLVHPNLEITWEPHDEGYRTSFFLKNRSPYVP
jgi:hypothetical protein